MIFVRSIWLRLIFGALICGVGAAGGCDCDDDLVEIPKASCDLETGCKDNQAYRYGKCVSTYCEADDECCPGTYCALASHACLPNTV